MEKRLNTKFDLYIKNFKDGIRDKMSQLQMGSSDAADLMEYIYEYDRLVLDKEDFIKRKRVKNSIPENNRCLAKRATGEQCTRRRKIECEFWRNPFQRNSAWFDCYYRCEYTICSKYGGVCTGNLWNSILARPPSKCV